MGISTESSRPSGCSLGMEAGGLRLSGVGDKVGSSRLEQNDFGDVFWPFGSLTGLVYIPAAVINTLKFIWLIISGYSLSLSRKRKSRQERKQLVTWHSWPGRE